ncbi:MAG: glycoside hydrolase family 127 protein [Bacteroidota bacterium]
MTTTAYAQDYPISPVSFTKVKLTDNFWLPRIKTNHEVTIPASFERCESTGRVKNFEMAAAKSGAFCTVYPFDDTDIYKTIEGASFSMSLYPDPKLDSYIDGLIVKVAAAQEPDGYLYTARTIDPAHPHKWAGMQRWEKERELSHELYNSGHLFEAAAAHYQATGKKNLLNIALKNADLVCATFGHDKMHVAPGHEVVEMGLVKLYRITGKKEYLETAKYFIEERGHYTGYDPKSKDQWKNGAYWQDHLPVVQQDEALGHAVRAGYLYAAVADVAALTGDTSFVAAIDKLWENVIGKKLYVQGGIGAIGDGEKFGADYELPNSTAYNETCAAIANVYWNQRMFQLHGDAKYVDVLERTLYNGLISGVGMDGKSFFYTNAMEIRNDFKHKDQERSRAGWFTCSCCPTNITRLVPSIPGYMYATKDDQVFVNLFANSAASLKDVEIVQENNYPWDGNLVFKITPKSSKNFRLLVRIPGWAKGEVLSSDLYAFENKEVKKVPITVNGKSIEYIMDKGYAVISRTWKKGDVVNVSLPMEVQKITSNHKVENNIGKIALQRGPLVYCAEWVDNNGLVSNLVLPPNASFETALQDGLTIIKSNAQAIIVDSNANSVSTKTQPFIAIPYYSWAHRGEGEMAVWLPQHISSIDIISK